MSDIYKRAVPGSPIKGIPAELYNALIDMLKDYRKRFPSSSFSPSAAKLKLENDLVIENQSEDVLDQFSVVGIGDPLVAPGDLDDCFFGDLVHASAPPSPGQPFAILQRPAAIGGLAKAVASGLTLAHVNMIKPLDQYALPAEEDYSRLISTSDSTAPACIVKQLDGDWCIVDICCQVQVVEPIDGVGELTNAAATCAGAGQFYYHPGGALINRPAHCAGSGTFTNPVYTGTGSMANRAASCNGSGVATPAPPSGTWFNRPATCSGTGAFSPPRTGTGALANRAARCFGVGAFSKPARTGTGALHNPAATCAGVGVVSALPASLTSPFVALVSNPAFVGGHVVYDWTAQVMDPSTGDYANTTISGNISAGPFMREMNENLVATPSYVRAFLRGIWGGQPLYDFDRCCTSMGPPQSAIGAGALNNAAATSAGSGSFVNFTRTALGVGSNVGSSLTTASVTAVAGDTLLLILNSTTNGAGGAQPSVIWNASHVALVLVGGGNIADSNSNYVRATIYYMPIDSSNAGTADFFANGITGLYQYAIVKVAGLTAGVDATGPDATGTSGSPATGSSGGLANAPDFAIGNVSYSGTGTAAASGGFTLGQSKTDSFHSSTIVLQELYKIVAAAFNCGITGVTSGAWSAAARGVY